MSVSLENAIAEDGEEFYAFRALFGLYEEDLLDQDSSSKRDTYSPYDMLSLFQQAYADSELWYSW